MVYKVMKEKKEHTKYEKKAPFGWNHISVYRSALMGIFMIWIILFHNQFQWGNYKGILYQIIRYGNVGVDAFLFLSGVGLYYSFSGGSGTIRDRIVPFYKKRLIRLLLPYCLFALPFYLWYCRGDVVLFFRSFFQVEFFANGSSTFWFIPWILICYLAFPYIFVLQNHTILIKKQPVSRNIITILMILLWFSMLILLKKTRQDIFQNLEVALTRGIVFILGCHCAKWVADSRRAPSGTALASAAFFFIYIFRIRNDIKMDTLWIRMSFCIFSISAIFLFTYFLWTLDKSRTGAIIVRILNSIGTITLELYLTHIIFRKVYGIAFGFPYIERRGIIDYILVIIMSFIVSWMGHKLIRRLMKRH